MTNTKWRVYVAATYDTKGHEAEYVAGLLARDGLDVVTVDVSTTGASSAARVQAQRCRPSSGRRAGGVHWRPWHGHRRHGAGLRALRRRRRRHRRAAGPGRLGRHGADHAGHARAAHRRAQADGVDHGFRQRRALCRAVRHRHDVLRHRRGRAEPHLAPRAGQCRRRHWRRVPPGRQRGPGQRQPSRRRHQHVRRDHGLRAAGGAAAGAGL